MFCIKQEKDQIISTYQVQIDRLVSKIEAIQESAANQEARNIVTCIQKQFSSYVPHETLVEENKSLTEKIQDIQKSVKDVTFLCIKKW